MVQCDVLAGKVFFVSLALSLTPFLPPSDSDKVEEHLKKAHALEPGDAAINAHFAVLKKMQQRDNVKSAGFFKGMFSALENENATAAGSSDAASAASTAGGASAASAGVTATDVDLNEENVTIEQ